MPSLSFFFSHLFLRKSLLTQFKYSLCLSFFIMKMFLDTALGDDPLFFKRGEGYLGHCTSVLNVIGKMVNNGHGHPELVRNDKVTKKRFEEKLHLQDIIMLHLPFLFQIQF